MGRPTKITTDVLTKLETALSMGCTVSEACAFANVCRDTFYEHIRNDQDFSDKIERWRLNPILKARKTVFDRLGSDAKTAQWYLERKLPQEYCLQAILSQKDKEKQLSTNKVDVSDPKIARTIVLTMLASLENKNL